MGQRPFRSRVPGAASRFQAGFASPRLVDAHRSDEQARSRDHDPREEQGQADKQEKIGQSYTQHAYPLPRSLRVRLAS